MAATKAGIRHHVCHALPGIARSVKNESNAVSRDANGPPEMKNAIRRRRSPKCIGNITTLPPKLSVDARLNRKLPATPYFLEDKWTDSESHQAHVGCPARCGVT
jgi:hypothetical protein